MTLQIETYSGAVISLSPTEKLLVTEKTPQFYMSLMPCSLKVRLIHWNQKIENYLSFRASNRPQSRIKILTMLQGFQDKIVNLLSSFVSEFQCKKDLEIKKTPYTTKIKKFVVKVSEPCKNIYILGVASLNWTPGGNVISSYCPSLIAHGLIWKYL